MKKSDTLPNFEIKKEKMAETISNMTKKEFTQILSDVVEKKIIELFGDPDEGLVLKENMRKRLLRQKKAVRKGNLGDDFETVAKRLSLK
ncbi:MAG: hypothetical protein M1480_08865 [Bacteroidetes bacterium]|nr:hypothetical protein [Bacteroidota bacterium]